MRIIGNIPHPSIRITLFMMNEKYIIKFEAGPMEQIFKLALEEVNGIEGIEKILDQEFMKRIMDRFNEMFLSYKEAIERYQILK